MADLHARLETLSEYVDRFPRSGTPAEFWAGFEALEGDLGSQAFADDVEPEVRERFCEILANADDAGWAVPDDNMHSPQD